MTATTAPDRPDPTRTGAVWVTGTGAFLLLSAAAVFTAVRWGEIHPGVKLAALVLATGGCLTAGRTLRPRVPATAGALFHLGTLLVPIVVAALGVHRRLEWPELLLAQGLVAAATFGWAARVERSVVLRWAWAASVVVLSGGIAAVTPVPASLVLAGAAVAAAAAGGGLLRTAVGWGAVAGLAPVLCWFARDGVTGAGTLHDLGLAPGQHPVLAGATSLLGAGVIAAVARRRAEQDLVVVAAAVAAAGVGASWLGGGAAGRDVGLAVAATFAAAQLAALVLRQDPFWHRPLAAVAHGAEPVAVLTTLSCSLAAFDASGDPSARTLLASVLLGVGWVAADRRRPVDLPGATTVVALCAVTVVRALTPDPTAMAIALVAVAAAALHAERRDGLPVAALASAWAPVVAASSVVGLVVAGAVGTLVMADAAVRWSRRPESRRDPEVTWLLTAVAVVPVAVSVAILSVGHDVALLLVALGAAAVAFAAGAWADRGDSASELPLGTLLRASALASLTLSAQLPALEVAALGAALTVGFAAEAVRQRQPLTALGSSLALPVAVGAFVHSTGLSPTDTGVALTVAAVVLAGAGSLLGRRWAVPVLAGTGLALVGGLVLAWPDRIAFANALLVAGGLTVAGGTAARRPELLIGGGLAVTTGWWLRLGEAGVDVAEPYLLPVAAVLLLAGPTARKAGSSSWTAYGPVVALCGSAALLERVQGGAGWHAVVAGGIGVVAVVAGASRRLAAPLLLGTALLVAVTGYETLDVTAGMPTWVWLASGGAALLTAGVLMERHEVGPIETGRRLVDVVSDRFG